MDISSIVRGIVQWFRGRYPGGQTSEVMPLTPIGAGYAGASPYDTFLRVKQERLVKLRDFEMMDEMSPEVSRALDVYADNCTWGSTSGGTYSVTFKKSTDEAQSVIDAFEKRSNIKSNVWSMFRDLYKFGDNYEELVYQADPTRPDGRGQLVGLKYLPPASIWMNLDAFGLAPNLNEYFCQRNDCDQVVATWPKECIAHWQFRSNRAQQYGTSILYSARRLFRQLHLIEDSMVIARLRRGNMRYVHKIDTANLPVEQRLELCERYKRRVMRERMIDPSTGQVRTEETPPRPEDDLFVPKEDDVSAIQGDMNLGAIQDVEYFRGKLFTCLGVPKAYMAREQDVGAKATLTQQDIQFCRTVRRGQQAGRQALEHIYTSALVGAGVDDIEELGLEILFPAINTVDELLYWQGWSMKAATALTLRRDLAMFDDEWLYVNIFGLSEADAKTMAATAKKRQAESASAGQAAGAPVGPALTHELRTAVWILHGEDRGKKSFATER